MAGSSKAVSPWAVFAVAATASYISTLDMSIVNVAFYEIQKDFPNDPPSTISWVVSAYSILYGALLVVSGRLADQTGRKRFFLWGTSLFLVGSVLCAVSHTMPLLIVGRAVQGIGGAMMTPASMGLLMSAFPLEKRGQVVAWTGSIGALGVASGPTIGALFVSSFGWRSAFWINVPICLVTLVLAVRVTRESEPVRGSRPDIGGAVVFTSAIGALVWGITRSEERGWGDTSVIALFVVAIALGLFVARRGSTHPDPILPAGMFKERTFTLANIATLLFGIAFSANILNNVLFQRTVWGFSATKAGLFSVLSPITVFVTSMIVGRKMAKIGYKKFLILGPVILAITVLGSVLLLDVEPEPWIPFTPLMFILGLGIGCTFPPLSGYSVLRLPPHQLALGGAINSTFRQVGAAIGVALLVTVQSRGSGIDGFRYGWLLVAACALTSICVSLFQPSRLGRTSD